MIQENTRTPLVSVVVPIYKVERYLAQCVDSILGQTLQDIEVILVDDGSPDNCPAMVDEYAAKDPRVVAIHQPNGGYGKAVNAGIARATAPYIGIIESDDWIEPTMYEKLYKRARETGADLVKCRFWNYDSTKPEDRQNVEQLQVLDKAPEGVFHPLEWDPLIMIHVSLWSYLYKAELAKRVKVLETQSAAYQDGPFVFEILARADSISIVKEPLVHYRCEAGQGSSGQQTGRRALQSPTTVAVARDTLARLGKLDTIKEAFYFWGYGMCRLFFMHLQPELRGEYCSLYRAAFAPLKGDKSFTYKYFSPWQEDDVRWLLAGHDLPKTKWHKAWFVLRHKLGFLKERELN